MTVLFVTACGSDVTGVAPASPVVAPPAKSPPTTLNGNWLLAGSRVPATYPVLSTSLFVQGNTISGMFTFETECLAAGIPSTVSSSGLALNGTIADDGTFQATSGTIGNGAPVSISVSVTGNSPVPAAPTVWTGTYSVAVSSGLASPSCNMTQTASFSASAIAPVTGTYLGVPITTPFGTGATVSVQILQAPPALVSQGRTMASTIPLTASLTIAHSACAVSTSTTGLPLSSSISGDHFQLFFPLSSPPYALLEGTLNDAAANVFFGDLTSLTQSLGCNGIAFYTFTRQ